MVRYNVYIIPRDGDEAITHFNISRSRVRQLRRGAPDDTFSFTVTEIEEPEE